MTEHSREWGELRVGATVTLRDWRGERVTGEAFLSPGGQWLLRTGPRASLPIVPRELVAVANGAGELWARLRDGAVVTFADWEGGQVTGIARKIPAGIWEAKDKNGARWLLEPYRIVSITTEG